MKAGQRVTIKAEGHQQNGQSGKLMAFKCVPELGMAWRSVLIVNSSVTPAPRM